MQINAQQTIFYLVKSRAYFNELLSNHKDGNAKYGIAEHMARLIQLHIKELDDYIFSMKRFESDRESLRKGNLPTGFYR